MNRDTYKAFKDAHLPKNIQSDAKNWEHMKILNESAKTDGCLDALYINMARAMDIFPHQNRGEIFSKDASERSLFLTNEVPEVVNILLFQGTKKSLAQACALTDQFADLFRDGEDVGACIAMQLSCARIALEQKEYGAALWQGREAALLATKYMESDGCSQPHKISAQQAAAVDFLNFDLAKAAERRTPRIATLAREVVTACIVFGADSCENPVDQPCRRSRSNLEVIYPSRAKAKSPGF